jgi:hypothetical protein
MQESYTFFETLKAITPVLYLIGGIIAVSVLFWFLSKPSKNKNKY